MSSLIYILNKRYDETFSATWINGPVELNNTNTVVQLKLTEPLTNIEKITTISDVSQGETKTVYFKKFFKFNNGSGWSDLLPLSDLSGRTFDKCELLDLELFYYRVSDGNFPNSLYLNNVVVNGKYNFNETDSEAILPTEGEQIILGPQDIYKIFSLSDFEVISNHSNYEIKVRFTQDDGRTYTKWEELTKDNLSTLRLNPLRFAKVQYLLTNLSPEQGLVVYDIILSGEFQNVSANYLKINKYGLKQDCLTTMQNLPGSPGTDLLHRDFYTACLGSYMQNTDQTIALANANKSTQGQLWNPYQFDKITQFNNMLGNNVSNMFGWTVTYHRTDPDNNGIDKYINEYTLMNVVDMKNIKIIVPDNKFPVDHMIINQFNLEFADTFEVHIMKDEFKNAFGVPYRPGQDDIVYFCEVNMLFYVKHAQAFKNIMNSATYWKVILEKYEHKTNIRNLVADSKIQIEGLTNNTTIDDILGVDRKQEEDKIANKLQTFPTSFEKVREQKSKYLQYYRTPLYIGNMDFATSYYDLSAPEVKNKNVINYGDIDTTLGKGDNRCFIMWVNFKNKYEDGGSVSNAVLQSYTIPTDKYSLLYNYDDTNKKGYEVSYQGDTLQFRLNDKQFIMQTELLTNVWYGIVINLDQRQKSLNMSIFLRGGIDVVLIDPISQQKVTIGKNDLTGLTYYTSQGYKGLTNIEKVGNMSVIHRQEYAIESYEFMHSQKVLLKGSYSYYTNLRIFNDVITYESMDNILRQNIIIDSQHLILADNSGKQLITTNLWTKNFK